MDKVRGYQSIRISGDCTTLTTAAFPLMMIEAVPVEAAVVHTGMTPTYNIPYLKPVLIM